MRDCLIKIDADDEYDINFMVNICVAAARCAQKLKEFSLAVQYYEKSFCLSEKLLKEFDVENIDREIDCSYSAACCYEKLCDKENALNISENI